MTMANEIPVRVEREIGSDGEPTGKYVFVVNELHNYYETNFDPGRMQRRLVNAGYEFQEFLPIINEMQWQYEDLKAEPHEPDDPPQAKEKGKPKGKSDEPPPPADLPATE